MKRNKDDIQIYLSKHIKVRNLGINNIKIINKKCKTIGVKRNQIYNRLARLSERERKAKIHILIKMAHDSYDENERNYVKDRLAEMTD